MDDLIDTLASDAGRCGSVGSRLRAGYLPSLFRIAGPRIVRGWLALVGELIHCHMVSRRAQFHNPGICHG